MATEYEVWGDNYVEADWFANLTPLLGSARLRILGGRGANPADIDDLLVYDRPDIILTIDGLPRLVLEKTREVPTGHNVGQRVARLVRSVERQLPTIKYFPFDAMKHGEYAGMCNLNIRLLAAFRRMGAIHEVPVLALNWPIDSAGELIVDGTEDAEVRSVVHEFVELGAPQTWPAAAAALARMDSEYCRRLATRPQYGALPPSVLVMTTAEFLAKVQEDTGQAHLLGALRNRDETLVYTMRMTPEKCRREDPYTGTQFVYDYAECRTGAEVDRKSRNLVLRFPLLTRATWYAANPNDPGRKSSNWYLTANALVFRDGVELLRISR